MSAKSRIAIFIGGYLPAKKYGGPVTSIANFTENLGDTFDIYIISNDHDLDNPTRLAGIHEGWNQVGKANVLYIQEKKYATSFFLALLQEIKADLVYLSSVFYYSMNFPAIRAANKMNIPIVLAPRGELCEGAINIGNRKKRLFLLLSQCIGIFTGVYFHATSTEEEKAVRRLLHPDSEHIVHLPNLPCSMTESSKKEKEPGEIRLVYVARIVKKKNLLYAIKRVKNCKANVRFEIYGPLEEKDYWNRCEKEIESSPPNVAIRYCGALDPGEANNIFRNYDAFIFPTYSENYGHVIAEAISSGCHLIVTKGATPWDDINGNGGFTIPLEEEEEWTNCIDKIASMTAEEYHSFNQRLYTYAEKKLAVKELSDEYRRVFSNLIGKNKRENQNAIH